MCQSSISSLFCGRAIQFFTIRYNAQNLYIHFTKLLKHAAAINVNTMMTTTFSRNTVGPRLILAKRTRRVLSWANPLRAIDGNYYKTIQHSNLQHSKQYSINTPPGNRNTQKYINKLHTVSHQGHSLYIISYLENSSS